MCVCVCVCVCVSEGAREREREKEREREGGGRREREGVTLLHSNLFLCCKSAHYTYAADIDNISQVKIGQHEFKVSVLF